MSIKDVSGLKCSALGGHDLKAKYRSVPQGGLIHGMRQFLSRLRPLPGMKSLSVGGGDQVLGVAEREVERCSRC